MNSPIHSTIYALCNRQPLMLAFVLTVISGIGLFINDLATSVDTDGWSSDFSHPQHGAGILVVRLCVLVFVFFLSHVACAQASANTSLALKSRVTTQNGNGQGYRSSLPDISHYQQLLLSSELEIK